MLLLLKFKIVKVEFKSTLNRDEICQGDDKTKYNTVYKKLLDIGDIIGIEG